MSSLVKEDLKYNWHPYTQMKDHEVFPPIFIKKAKGIKLYDDHVNWYYDTISSWWCNLHGHGHPKIIKAVNDQMKKVDHVMFAGFTHESAIRLSEQLVKIAPKGLTRVFYSDNGSTAVETALKMSLQYRKNTGEKGRNKFIALRDGYHGDTAGTMSVSGVDLFNKVFKPMFFASYKVPTPNCNDCPMGKVRKTCKMDCIKPLEKLLKQRSKKISGFIIEPLLMGAAGMIIYPKEYLEKAYKLCRRYGVHFIADEVAVGFGRTGKMFACELAGITPDFLCLSKGLTAGMMAMGVTMTTEKIIYNAFYGSYKDKKTFYHGHTFTANPIACSVALASLDIFNKERVLNNVADISKEISSRVQEFKRYVFVDNVRSLGMVAALDLVKDRKTKVPFSFEDRAGYKVYKQGLKNNLVLRPIGNTIYLYLPLCTTVSELKDILRKMHSTFKQLEGSLC